jgi:hypothetical protein
MGNKRVEHRALKCRLRPAENFWTLEVEDPVRGNVSADDLCAEGWKLVGFFPAAAGYSLAPDESIAVFKRKAPGGEKGEEKARPIRLRPET